MFPLLLRNCSVCVRRSAEIVCRDLCISQYRQAQLPKLSPYDVNLLLRENEFSHVFVEEHAIHSYDSNQVGSNTPCEDCRTEATLLHNNGFICGIFDGHGGPACSQVISKRLLRYIAASMTDRDILRKEMAKGCNSQSFLKCYNDKVDFVKEIKILYESSFKKYLDEITKLSMNPELAIENAFLSLDEHISMEALNNPNLLTMSVAMSGSVACVVYINGMDVYVAGVGDCAAVLGNQSTETGQWQLKKLTNEHNSENIAEVQRILSMHPQKEHDTIIRGDRLLGQLAPLRALGDFRYKWSIETMKNHVLSMYKESVVPPYYFTPPYLTAQPEIQHHVLTADDKFLVIASDGLWDFMTPSQVIDLLADHIGSKKVLEPIKFPQNDDVNLETILQTLAERKAGQKSTPLDQNSATHLIRHALGSTDYGIEHSKISYYLSLPPDVVRLYRDDITITIIYFNSDYIRKCTVAKDE